MSPIERLPTEIVQYIAELCTWDSAPPEDGFPSEIDAPRYKSRSLWQPPTYARYHAAFARASRHFHDILNERLYARNLFRDPSSCSCLRWAVRYNRLETIKRAHDYRADLSSYGPLLHFTTLSEDRESADIYIKLNGVLALYTNFACCKWGRSPLYDAAYFGFSNIVEFLLENGVKVEEESPGRAGYPLMAALEQGHEETAEKLISHGAYLLEPGLSALPLAFAKRFQGVVETLLKRKDPVSLVGKLHIGASSDNPELVKQSLDGAEVNVNAPDFRTETALHLAIKSAKGKLDVIKFLLRQPGIQVSTPDRFGEVPIHLAVDNGRMDIVRLLTKMPSFDINCRTNFGETALHRAARAASKEIFTHLLEQRGLEHSHNEGLRRLLSIISGMSDDVLAKTFVQLLLDSGVHLDPDPFKLVKALHHGNLSTASKLLSITSQENFDSNYGPGARNTRRSGPLHHVLMLQDPRVTTFVRELIARGVNVQEAPTSDSASKSTMECKATPIFYAAAFARNIDCMKMLFEAGADATSAVQVRVERGGDHEGYRTMSMLSGLFSHVWRNRRPTEKCPIECPIWYPGPKEPPIAEGMSELQDRILMLLQHGATLNDVGDCPSALSIVCTEAVQSSSLTVLKWLTDNSTTRNVSVEHVDSRLKKHPLVENERDRRRVYDLIGESRETNDRIKKFGEIHNILKGFKEKLLREGNED